MAITRKSITLSQFEFLKYVLKCHGDELIGRPRHTIHNTLRDQTYLDGGSRQKTLNDLHKLYSTEYLEWKK